MDEKIREELFKYRGDYYTTREALTAIKKIFYEEIIARLPKGATFILRSAGSDERNFATGINNYRKETIKLLGEICGVENET